MGPCPEKRPKTQIWYKKLLANCRWPGDCTDICIQQFAVAGMVQHAEHEIKVIVPVNAVDTYDAGTHDGELVSVMALYNLILNGIEVADGLET